MPSDLVMFLGVDGGLGPPRRLGTTAVFGLAGGDFDGDGKKDLAGAFPGAGGVSSEVGIHFGSGDGTFAPPVGVTVGRTPGSLAAADLNGDGRDDLAVLNYDSKDISILLSLGDRSFAPQALYTSGEQPTAIATADVNGDGFVDLVTGNSGISFVPGTGDVPVLGDLGKPEAGSEGQRVDHVVPRVASCGSQDCSLLGAGQGRRAEVGHGRLLSAAIHAWVGRSGQGG